MIHLYHGEGKGKTTAAVGLAVRAAGSGMKVLFVQFFKDIPKEILEAGEMDSCSQLGMLFRICIPLSKPMISTIGLFSALAYWNDWVNGMYYLIRRKDLKQYRLLLRKLL